MYLVLIAHFDPSGIVPEYWYSLVDADFGSETEFVLCTTSINEENFQIANECFDAVIKVPNIGYDFYSWHIGLKKFFYESDNVYDYVVLINSSIFISDVKKFSLAWNFPDSEHVYCFTTSNEISYHAQSYFLAFPSDVLNYEEIASFWLNLRPISDRQQVIYSYELGLSRCIIEAGFSFMELSRISVFDYLRLYVKYIFNLGFLDNLRGVLDWRRINKVVYFPCFFDKEYGFYKLKLNTPFDRLFSHD
jgi:lipopolysaccharide biosynthesis protein